MRARRRIIIFGLNCFFIVFFSYIAYILYQIPFNVDCIRQESSFYLGLFVGISAMVAYISFINVFVVLFKYCKAKIRKRNLSFIDVLNDDK